MFNEGTPGTNVESHRHTINQSNGLSYFRGILSAHMTTLNRLSIVSPPNLVKKEDVWTHPIHYVYFKIEYMKILNEYFEKAFGYKVVADNMTYGNHLSLRISKDISFDVSGSNVNEINEKLIKKYEKMECLHEQGDGMCSFAGVLLYLILKNYLILLIDEPESFLHPPQAYQMGEMIGELSKNKQVFISTHSIDVIKGLINTCANRVKIIRITRENNQNEFKLLENADVIKIQHDTILRHTNILDGLFYKKVFLCESDSDCQFYSMIKNHLDSKKNRYDSSLFIHSNGKDRMPNIVESLKKLSVETMVIVDIDILKDEFKLKQLIESKGESFDLVFKDYKILEAEVRNIKAEINRDDARNEMVGILNLSQDKHLTKTELDGLQKIINTSSKWGLIKKSGSSIIPNGQASSAYRRIIKKLIDMNIFIVEVGEIENFIKPVGGHGVEWVNNVIESYPDLTDPIYRDVKKFIVNIDKNIK